MPTADYSADARNWAWAAGLFEGEGCIILRRNHGPWLARALHLSMCDEDVVRRFQEIVGAGNIYPYRRRASNHRDIYVWRCGRWPEIERILNQLLPYLGERRRAKALKLLANPALPQGGQRKTHCKRGHELNKENAPVRSNGRRACRLCQRIHDANYRERQRAMKETM